MKEKVLLVSTVSGFIPKFELNNVKILLDNNMEIHYATNYNNPAFSGNNEALNNLPVICHQVDFKRNPLDFKNIKAYKQLLKIVKENKFRFIHCHTPMGAVLTRLVANKLRFNNVIYTAHGFHFYHGAPLINRLIYYNIEKFLSRYTDSIICVNMEDYVVAKSFSAKNVYYIPGVGIDTQYIEQVEKNNLREELKIDFDSKIIVTAGEMIKRKNQTFLIDLAKRLPNDVKLVICGHGELEQKLKNKVDILGIHNKVFFLGYRNDVLSILKASDIFVFSSTQEGLPVAMIEAMSCALPVVCSDIRGNRDLIDNDLGGYLIKNFNFDTWVDSVTKILNNFDIKSNMGVYNKIKSKKYDSKVVIEKMKEIYGKYI